MERAHRTYRWCEGCERRIAEELFRAARCPGCHDDAKRKLFNKTKEITFTEEEYEAMGDMNYGEPKPAE